jgi:hypothetical protein
MRPERIGLAVKGGTDMSKKTWTKPIMTATDASLEVTAYMPSVFEKAEGRSCK